MGRARAGRRTWVSASKSISMSSKDAAVGNRPEKWGDTETEKRREKIVESERRDRREEG